MGLSPYEAVKFFLPSPDVPAGGTAAVNSPIQPGRLARPADQGAGLAGDWTSWKTVSASNTMLPAAGIAT